MEAEPQASCDGLLLRQYEALLADPTVRNAKEALHKASQIPMRSMMRRVAAARVARRTALATEAERDVGHGMCVEAAEALEADEADNMLAMLADGDDVFAALSQEF